MELTIITPKHFVKQFSLIWSTYVCILYKPVKDSGSSNGERHHHDEVGEEGEGAEDNVGPAAEPRLDNLQHHGF